MIALVMIRQHLDHAAFANKANRKPQPQSWMAYSVGRSDFHVGAVTIRPKQQIRSELYFSGDRAKIFFGLLKRQKDTIEKELGYPLEWEEMPSRRDCRISSYLNEVDPEDEADWPRQHTWLAKRRQASNATSPHKWGNDPASPLARRRFARRSPY